MATQTTEPPGESERERCLSGRLIHLGMKRVVVPCEGSVVKVLTLACEEGKHIHHPKPVCRRCLKSLLDSNGWCMSCLVLDGRASRLSALEPLKPSESQGRQEGE